MKKLFSLILNFLVSKTYVLSNLLKGNLISPFANFYGIKGLFFNGKVTVKSGAIFDASAGKLLVGEGVWINSDVEVVAKGNIEIGNRVSIQKSSRLYGSVKVGDDSILAPNVFISSGTHVYDAVPGKTIREQESILRLNGGIESYNKPIEIGKNVWLGINVVVMPGVIIGDNVVVGANSVVTSSVESNVVVAGVPAKKLRAIDNAGP